MGPLDRFLVHKSTSEPECTSNPPASHSIERSSTTDSLTTVGDGGETSVRGSPHKAAFSSGKPNVSLKYCVNDCPVPVFTISDTGERTVKECVSEVVAASADGIVSDGLFFDLHCKRSKWFADVFGIRPQQTTTFAKLKRALAESFGKKTVRNWCMTKDKAPVKKDQCVDVRIDGTTVSVLQSRKCVGIRASVESLTWLVTSVYDELASSDGLAPEDKDKDDEDEEDHISQLVRQPFDQESLQLLDNYKVKWYPSKRSLLCCVDGNAKKATKIKVSFNMMKRKRYGDEKFSSYVSRRAQKAMRVALEVSASMVSHGTTCTPEMVQAAREKVMAERPDDVSESSDTNQSESDSDN